MLAAVIAIATEGGATGFAIASVTITRCASAVGASGTMPVFQHYVGTTWVVRLQDVMNQREEVVEPTLLKGTSNRVTPVTLTKRFLLHVRVRYAVIYGCRIGVQSDD